MIEMSDAYKDEMNFSLVLKLVTSIQIKKTVGYGKNWKRIRKDQYDLDLLLNEFKRFKAASSWALNISQQKSHFDTFLYLPSLYLSLFPFNRALYFL